VNFNTPEFFIFLPTVILLFAIVNRNERLRDLLLLAASYFFYMSWNWKYAGLIAFSTILDYSLGLRLAKEERPTWRKFFVIISLVGNLGLLGFFKYYYFFTDLGRDTMGLFGLDISFPAYQFLLPVGISFYTFQTLSYSIDLYRKKIDCERNFLKFAIFVSFFPQLVAGPIVRASHFLPQIRKKFIPVEENNFMAGLLRVFRGLFKKIVIADILAQLGVEAIFSNPEYYSSVDLLFAMYGYAYQIYNDFSGYSDIAIGAAAMLGFNIPENFNKPYVSQNIREFWQRWHISLSTWFRDYLYLPIAYSTTRKFGKKAYFGMKKDMFIYMISIGITFILCGLWHGAAINFVLWGGYHGVLIIISRWKNSSTVPKSTAERIRRQFICFHLVLFGWLIFRIHNFSDFIEYLEGLFRFSTGSQLSIIYYLILGMAIFMHILPQNIIENLSNKFLKVPALIQAFLYVFLILIFLGFGLGSPQFIYFQF
jgi:D-alanyl-lipoteichoic acid acyltransferase DltB (MBOAT superfamily)